MCKSNTNIYAICVNLLILRKNFENSDRSMYAICVGLGKFCSQLALFTEKFTQSTKFLRDHRSRQISCLITDLVLGRVYPLKNFPHSCKYSTGEALKCNVRGAITTGCFKDSPKIPYGQLYLEMCCCRNTLDRTNCHLSFS